MVDVLDGAPAERLHQPGRRSICGGRQQQMNMVGYPHVNVNGAAASVSRFFQPVEVTVVVLFGEKAGLTIDAALNDVQRNFGKLDTWATGHD